MRKILVSLMITIGIITILGVVNISQGYAQGGVQPPTADQCSNLLINGDMENSSGWNIASNELPAQYVPLALTGQQSLSLGVASDQSLTGQAWSSAWQAVSLPDNSTAVLSFWYRAEMELDSGNDRYYVALLNEDDRAVKTFLDTDQLDSGWNFFSDEVLIDAGGAMQLFFGVENDGLGSATRLLVDEVVLCVPALSGPPEAPNNPIQTTPVLPLTEDDPFGGMESLPSNNPIQTTPALPLASMDDEAPNNPIQTASTLPLASADDQDLITLDRLGFSETRLLAPSGQTRLLFNLPANWEITEDAEMQLDLSIFSGNRLAADDTLRTFLGTLEVRLNDTLLTSVLLSQDGEQRLDLSVPSTTLIPVRTDGQHELIFSFYADAQCGVTEYMSVIIRPSSSITIPHQLTSPPTDLRLLPRPVYQATFLPDSAAIVVPDQPTAAELQAALTVAAGFGQMTRSSLNLSLIPLGQLTPEVQEATHLIFVGHAAAFPTLADLSLPAPSNGADFEVTGAEIDDGVIQMVVSPWNEAKVILIVSGASDTAVIKASQAVSTGAVRIGTPTNLALVAQIRPTDALTDSIIVDRTLADLGNSIQQVKNRGTNYIEYYFDVPPGYMALPGAYLEVVLNHSALLDYEQSGMVVRLNGTSIGSLNFSDEYTSLNGVRFNIPRSLVRPGSNELQIRAELEPHNACIDPGIGAIWLTIWPESLLHLPLNPVQGELRLVQELSDYPNPFIQDPTLGSTAFIVPPDDLVAWNVAMQIASDLGDRSDTPLANLVALYGDAVPEDIRQERHLLIVGRPSTLPIVDELSESLPAPFETGSDLALERAMRVQYRFPPDASLGYLEMFPAPWNRSRIVLAVLGSTGQGVQWAGITLTTPQLRNKLKNIFAIISDEQIINGEVQPETDIWLNDAAAASTMDVASPGLTDESPEPASPSDEPAKSAPALASEGSRPAGEKSVPVANQPVWVLPLLMTSGLLTVIIVGVVLVSSLRSRH